MMTRKNPFFLWLPYTYEGRVLSCKRYIVHGRQAPSRRSAARWRVNRLCGWQARETSTPTRARACVRVRVRPPRVMEDNAKTLKEKATKLYKEGQFAVAIEAYEDARIAAANKREVDVSTLAVLHANKAAALLAAGGRDSEAAKEGAMAVMLDEGYARARHRVTASCVRLGVPAVIDVVHRAYADLDGLYAFHRDVRRGIEGGDVKLLRALRQVDAARVAGNDAYTKGAHGEAALAYTAGLTPDPYNPYGDNKTPDGKHDFSPIVGGAVLLCNRAAAHAALGRHEEALSDAEAALAADDTYVKARGRQCEALVQLGRGREALGVVARLEKEKPAGDAQLASVRHRAKQAAQTEKRAENADLIERAKNVELPPEYAAWVAGKGGKGGAGRGGGGGGGAGGKKSSKKRKKDDSDSDSDSSSSSSSSSSGTSDGNSNYSSSSSGRRKKKKSQKKRRKNEDRKKKKKKKKKSS